MPTPPPLKRQKHEKETCTECQRLPSGGPCARHQSIHEYQTLRSALEDPVVSLSTIERQLRKLEAKLRVEPAPRAPSPPPPAPPPSSNLPPTTPTPTAHGNTELADPVMSLQADGIHIHTSITEPHHFVKLLVRGINPTHVHDQAKRVFTRPLDLVFPDTPIPQPPALPSQPPTTQTIDDFANDPAELAWVDRVLATRYPRCFLMYQQTEADRLVQWISPAYIQGLHNQPKVEHSLLSKAVRAFVYRHEATHHHQSDHHHHHQQQQPLDEIDHEENQPFERKRKERISTFFFQQAEELLELCYTTSSRNTIRALLHMNMCQWLTPGGEQKAAQYCDLALRMAQDLQLQRDGGVLVNEQLREDDRRLWWSVVWAHLWTATSFDRPLLIDPDIMTNARPPAKRVSEATEVGLCVDFCVHSVRLLVVIHKIRQTLAKKTTELHLLDQLQEMERLLLAWRQQLPDALQPEHYWQLAASNAISNASSTSTMWMTTMDDYGGDVRARALAVELSILLLGQWARVKLQLYECFATDDRSILDLLMLRNRLDIANEFTSYLVHIVQRARPCMLMYLLTAIHPCLHTFLELATPNRV
ncbi:hypothetical protein BC940DRAFT_311041 [Gongronella butleri]|nr:hypothetical protein BC940DRAFT_311041 [Gongronella butleri]